MNTKTEFKYFTITEYEAEEEYLSNMHAHGWRLVKITFPGFYTFEECEAKRVVYRIDYPGQKCDKREYRQIFEDCGWEYLFDFARYSYFCKEMTEDDDSSEIFCDDESRYDFMKRVLREKVVPLIIIFFGTIFPQMINARHIINIPGAAKAGIVLLSLLTAIMGFYIVLFVSFALKFRQYEKRTFPDNPKLEYKYIGLLALLGVIIVGIGLTWYMWV